MYTCFTLGQLLKSKYGKAFVDGTIEIQLLNEDHETKIYSSLGLFF